MKPKFRLIKTIRKEPFLETSKLKDENEIEYISKEYKDIYSIQPEDQITFFTSLSSLQNIEHPSILSIYSYNLCNINKILYPTILTKYLPRGSLQSIFDMATFKKVLINWKMTNNYITILGISLGMNYLHTKGIMHQNLKPANILFDDNFYPKICDIDLFHHSPKKSKKSYDIYCFAEIIYEIITNKRPPIQIESIQNVINQEFFSRCISSNINEVPSFTEILDFITLPSFRKLFGQININEVIQYLRIFEGCQEECESYVVHGMLLYNNGTKEQKEEASFLFKKGADLGSVNGMIKYAFYLDEQKRNKEESRRYYQKAIDKGDGNAIYKCACLLMNDCKSNEDKERIGLIFKKSADKGFILSCYRYAIISYQLNKKEEAFVYLKVAADNGHVKSMFNLALMYEKGDGIEIDKNKAILFYKKAIEKGDIQSMNNYANLIKNNNNKEDKKLAVYYFKKSADNGNSLAMCNYALMRQIGQGIEKNKEEAKSYYLKSIEKGNPKAMIQYGRMLELDNNIGESLKYYKMAAEKKKTKAMNNLISLIEKGYDVGLNEDKILQYSKIAADKGRICSMLFYSRILYRQLKKDESIQILKKSIEKGSSKAMNEYGKILELESESNDENKIKEAAYFYKKAIDNGDTNAIQNYFNIIEKYDKILSNDENKEKYIQIAADFNNNDNIFAMYKYALILYNKNPQPFFTYFGLNLLDNPKLKSLNYFHMIIQKAKNNFNDIIFQYQSKNFSTTNKKSNNFNDVIIESLNYFLDFYKDTKFRFNKFIEKENTSFFKIAADLGNKIGMFVYGIRLKRGFGVDKNLEEAFHYIKMASDLNYPLAIQYYAEFLEKGIGTEKNYEESKKYYLKSIESGNIRSNYLYALLLLKTEPEKKEEALKYLKIAADNDDKDASYKYAHILKKDKNNKDDEIIKFYSKKSADLGNIKGMLQYANLMLNVDTDESLKYYIKASDKGNIEAIFIYTDFLIAQKSINYGLIIYYLKKAVDKDDIPAMIKYGDIMQSEDNPFQNLEIALQNYKNAAEKGNEEGEIKCIKLLANNEIKFENRKELASYMKKGCDLKIVKAIYKYSKMLKSGDGVEIDEEKASQYLFEAAELGDIDAMSDYTSEILSKKGIVNYNFDHFKEESMKYQKILLDYKNDNTKVFVDENFPSFKNWKRIDEIYNAPLFKKELISPNLVNQGSIGNCYFIAALSRIAKQYYLIPQLFERNLPNLILGKVENSINIKCGAVVIYFQAFGKRTPVLIDTFIPMKNEDEPLLSSLSDKTKSPWFCLVEKAFSKLCGSFSNTIGGFSSISIYSLFFYYPKLEHILSLKTKKLNPFQQIMKYQKKGYLITASFRDKKPDLINDHCYFIFKVREVENQRFICLRNPWGKNEYKGKFSENSPYWTPQLKKDLGFDECKNGTFYMTDEEFFSYFENFEIIKPILPEWNIKSFHYKFSPGSHDGVNIYDQNANFQNRQSFAFQITEPMINSKKCRFHIIVETCRSTFNDQINNKKNSQYYLILGHLNGRKFDNYSIRNKSLTTSFQGFFNVDSFSFDLKNSNINDIITIALHRSEKHDFCEDCYVSILCEYKFKLYDIDNPQQFLPDVFNPGIVFENFTISFPKISNPLVLKFFDNRFVLSFGTITSHENQENFAKFFQFANKKVGTILKLEDFRIIGSLIGSGSNGRVYPVEEIRTKKKFAAKISNHFITQKKAFLREVTVLRSLKYPSIINFKGFIDTDFIDHQFPTLIMECLNKYSLYNVLKDEHFGILNDEIKKKWTRTKKMINIIGIALGMDYIHRHNIIHRDLKFQNILHDDDLFPKICDFGCAKLLDIESGSKTTNIGTKLYMAPEIENGDNKYSYPVDVYSFGIMLYFIYSYQIPDNNTCSIDFDLLDKKYHPFVSNLIDKNPDNRPTFSKIVNDLLYERDKTWINGVDENEVELYLHKFGLSIKPKNKNINFDLISSITDDLNPQNAKNPKLTIEQIIENESIPQNIKDEIKLAENYVNINLSEEENEEKINEIGNLLYNVGYLFSYGNKESIFTIQEDLYYAIKYLKKATLCKNSYAACLLAYIFSGDSNHKSHEIAFNSALIASDLGSIDSFFILGIFYQNGVGTNKNIVLSAIYFKIAADYGNIHAMMYYANILMRIGQHEIDFNNLKNQINVAEDVIHNLEGRKNFIYNETRLTIEALENEDVALFVSQRYFEKASKRGNKEAEEKLLLIKKNSKDYYDHPQYYDELFLTLDHE